MSDVTKHPSINGLCFQDDIRGVYVDELLIGQKADGTYILSWQFRMPDGTGQEVSRVVVIRPHLERMVDTLCRVMEYTQQPAKSDPKPDHGPA